MNRGGIETWLLHVLRNIDRERFTFDFLIHTRETCAYDAELQTLGARLLRCPDTNNPFSYSRRLKKVLMAHGPYDAVHAHLHHFNGIVMLTAKSAGVPRRIAHSHTDTRRIDSRGSLLRKLYIRTSAAFIRRYSTNRLAVSDQAATSLFGDKWQADPVTRILRCGLDFKSFEQRVHRHEIRSEFGISPEAVVVGHVGRFVPAKNHEFLLQILAQLIKGGLDARLLSVGDGPLYRDIDDLAISMGIRDRVYMPGSRSDIARLMCGAMDVFIMPSTLEGLGLAAIEAQAAGLACILSDRIASDVDCGAGLVQFISLDQSPAKWAAAVMAAIERGPRDRRRCLPYVSRFGVQRSISSLQMLYLSEHEETLDSLTGSEQGDLA
jgi:glycosyltransferase involved in cell wall biosynthesis